jgi:hypothetical protein
MTNNPSVEIEEINDEIPITTGCVFCEKTVLVYKEEYSQNRAVGHGNFYCPFCIRNGHHHSDASQHKLILSFRGIIGFYYWQLYQTPNRSIYLSEIESCVREHVSDGLQHPAFSYDPETLNWYIDFRLVGTTRHKFPIKTVHDNIDFILECFQLKKRVPHLNPDVFQNKFTEAINLYYEQRQRPKTKKVLCPTFVNCGSFRPDMDFESTKTLPTFFFSADVAGENAVNLSSINNHEDEVREKENALPRIVVNVKEKDGQFEGVVTLPGLKPTKLSRKDGRTTYPTKASITSGVRALERRMGMKVEIDYEEKIAAK